MEDKRRVSARAIGFLDTPVDGDSAAPAFVKNERTRNLFLIVRTGHARYKLCEIHAGAHADAEVTSPPDT